jgi:cation diffusion facilitator family transporter
MITMGEKMAIEVVAGGAGKLDLRITVMSVNSKRSELGRQSGIIVLLSNLALFGGKYVVGMVSGSVAIQADAINNLTDTASALIATVGFQIAMRPHDKGHPQGHGRAEYISGLVISCLIVIAGLGLVGTTWPRLMTVQSAMVMNGWVVMIPVVAIMVKLGLAFYLYRLNLKIHSATVKATMIDCLSDTVITALTVVTLLCATVTTWPVDAWLGLAIAALIIYNGAMAFWENVNLLMGTGLSVAAEQELSALVDAQREFNKIEQIITNDFGPGNLMVVVQLQANCKKYDAEAIQTAADRLSAQLSEKFDWQTIVYWRSGKEKGREAA